MSKRKKRLEQIRQNPKNVSLEALRRVLEDYGFTLERIEGSHHHFSYILNGQKKLFTIPHKRPLNRVYVKESIKIIDKLIEAQGDQDEDE
jgi:predicted RNA binding protein YcfA (HicA-like mRNA interferase family)